ncbi:unnamed protein product [Mucor hiemalis]
MRLESKVKVTRLAKYALFAYIFISLFYTSNHYFTSHHRDIQTSTSSTAAAAAAAAAGRDQSTGEYLSSYPQEKLSGSKPIVLKKNDNKRPITTNVNVETHNSDQVFWPGSKGSDEIHTLSEQLIKSKIFSSSMGLDNVTPYYFKASRKIKSQDITLATLVTRNRFRVLSRLATNYKGPISAAIHVLDDKDKVATIKELGKIYSSNPDMQKYVDVHLIIDKFDRQFNMWRNTAKLFTRSDYLMMLDVDFHLCTDFRRSIFNNPALTKMLQSGKTAIVVPAFEYVDQKDGDDWRTFPVKKEDVIQQVNDLKLDTFHSSWVSGHGATNYTHWYSAKDIYPVTEYEFSYEPYVIYKKEGTPWCDERFIGYGANKAACLYEIFISGVDYYVLPNDFLIHQSHKYANHDRTREVRRQQTITKGVKISINPQKLFIACS